MPGYVTNGYDLATAKNLAFGEIENIYQSKIADVFDSNALGAPHRYYCTYEHQMNILNAAVAAKQLRESSVLMCSPLPLADPEVYNWISHGYQAAQGVYEDYVTFKNQYWDWYQTNRNAVQQLTTVEEVDLYIDNMLQNQG
jgi:TRAP-type mannitol/chloroaromatic compound transport system substrate-binding protein